MADFVPRSDDTLVTWLVNLQARLAVHATALGLTPAAVTAFQARCQRLVTAVQAVEPAQAALAAAVQAKEDAKGFEIPLLRAEINQFKTNPAATPSMLADMQVVGTTTAFDPEGYTAELAAEVVSGHVRLKFKKGKAEGVNIYARLRGQSAWTFLARDTSSPYDDHRALSVAGVAEVREYQAFGVLKDEQIGQPSDIVSVTFGG